MLPHQVLSPLTLLLAGTGTDYASATFKTASDTIAVANPPAMFGYDLVASSNNIYAGDNLTYDYSISNATSSNTMTSPCSLSYHSMEIVEEQQD